jgi:hypothetical protein
MLPMDERGWRTLAAERGAVLRGEVRQQPSSRRVRRTLGTALIAIGMRLAPGALPVHKPVAGKGDVQCMAARVWARQTVSSRARPGT